MNDNWHQTFVLLHMRGRIHICGDGLKYNTNKIYLIFHSNTVVL